MRRSLLILSLSFTSFVGAQLSEVQRITKTLCSPEFHGRGYVFRGDSLAAEFIAAEFHKLGIKKVKGSRFQEFTHDVNTFPGKIRLDIGSRSLIPGIDFLVDPSSPAVKRSFLPCKISYQEASNPELLMRKLREATAEEPVGAFIFDFSGIHKDSLKRVRDIPYKVLDQTKCTVFEITDEKFTWSVADKPGNAAFIELRPGFWKEGDSIHVEIAAQYILNYKSRNVMAFLKGRGCSKNTLVFTAHYDHLGRLGTDTYFPGANDNASGTAMLLSMAKYFKENRPNFNVLFIAFAAEEAGLKGSEFYVQHPVYPLNKMDFLINLDIMGSGEEGVTIVNATLFEKEFQLLQEINSEGKLLSQIKSRGPAANSDHYWFTGKGVPAFFIYTMGPNKNYHDVFDTHEALTFNEYEDITALLIEFGKRKFSK
jgi:aminopeptidase YwaD